MTLTPPFKPLSKEPFPRPPARTWALMTISSPPAFVSYLRTMHHSTHPASLRLTSPRLHCSRPRLSVHQCHTAHVSPAPTSQAGNNPYRLQKVHRQVFVNAEVPALLDRAPHGHVLLKISSSPIAISCSPDQLTLTAALEAAPKVVRASLNMIASARECV